MMKKSLILLVVLFFSFSLVIGSECDDSADNDEDGLVDSLDSGCQEYTTDLEGKHHCTQDSDCNWGATHSYGCNTDDSVCQTSCKHDAQCPDGYGCLYLDNPDFGGEYCYINCMNNDQCKSGYSCNTNTATCVSDRMENNIYCSSNSDCGTGYACDSDGVCYNGCNTNIGCVSGYTCSSNWECIEIKDCGAYAWDSDTKKCYHGCDDEDSGLNCADGYICSGHECVGEGLDLSALVPDLGLDLSRECTLSSDCINGYTCDTINGVCYRSCTSDLQCLEGYACDAKELEGSCVAFCAEGVAQCSDGIDNDGDLLIDYALDTECRSPLDNDESSNPKCADGIDNNNDKLIDYPLDLDCLSPEQNHEGAIVQASPEINDSLFFKLWDFVVFWN